MATPRQPPTLERRRRRRILTLRNFRNVVLVALAVLIVLNIRSEMRDTTGGEYGRLYGRGIESMEKVAPRLGEDAAPVDEAASADPFSLESARREQYLGTPAFPPVPLIDPATESIAPSSGTHPATTAGLGIVGDADGVAIVSRDTRPAPVLGGGFGRN